MNGTQRYQSSKLMMAFLIMGYLRVRHPNRDGSSPLDRCLLPGAVETEVIDLATGTCGDLEHRCSFQAVNISETHQTMNAKIAKTSSPYPSFS